VELDRSADSVVVCSGIERCGSDHNIVSDNHIAENTDGLADGIRCQSGSGNTGDNVVPACGAP
jgi:hypothetical protein